MPIILTLSTPVTYPSTTVLSLERLTVDFRALQILIQWFGNNGEAFSAVYPTPPILNPNGQMQLSGDALIKTLIVFNFSAGTDMERLIFTFLQGDGYVAAGTLSGSQD